MTCKDCLHYEICEAYSPRDSYATLHCAEECVCFTDRSEWVHLPFKLGDTVWFITGIHNTLIQSAKVEELSIDELGVSYIGVRTDNNIYFEKNTNYFHSTREEAEKALIVKE